MPEFGRFEKVPRPESIEAFIRILSGSNAVTRIEQPSDQILRTVRPDHSPLSVYMTNHYVVGEADAVEIMGLGANLDAIVTLSAWNGYTHEAKDLCKGNKIGLFTFKQFLGAVYYDGQEYLDYVPPEERNSRKS